MLQVWAEALEHTFAARLASIVTVVVYPRRNHVYSVLSMVAILRFSKKGDRWPAKA
jgi:hypothetical protein